MRESGRIFFTIGSIDYLKHGGRIGKLSGLAASVLGIKPLITLKDGEIYNSGISRSRKASMAKVIELLKQYIEERKIDMKKWQLCIGFGYDREEAVAFQKQILSELGGIITEAECPFRVCRHLPFPISQMRRVRSAEALTHRRPSVVTDTKLTQSECPSRECKHVPASMSQMRRVQS